MNLNDLEISVLNRLAEEKLPKEIGLDLSISTNKVKTIISELKKKLNAKTEVGLIKTAISFGIIENK
jgi:DNA-binding CsgD family transcriptional regulator